jgi:hypothetical protein
MGTVVAGESFGHMLERAFAARFGSTDAAPGHPLEPSNRVAPMAAAEPAATAAAAAEPGAAASGFRPAAAGQALGVQHQQQAAHPDVPLPGSATLATPAGPEHGKPKDPDAPLPTGGQVPRCIVQCATLSSW